jgi:hypothetical protein
MDDWDIDDEMVGITVTFAIAELIPGTYVYLDADSEILATGALDDDNKDRRRKVPPARDGFPEDDDIDSSGKTTVGPLMAPRTPAPLPRLSANDDDDDDDPDNRTTVGPLMKPRHPAPPAPRRK